MAGLNLLSAALSGAISRIVYIFGHFELYHVNPEASTITVLKVGEANFKRLYHKCVLVLAASFYTRLQNQ